LSALPDSLAAIGGNVLLLRGRKGRRGEKRREKEGRGENRGKEGEWEGRKGRESGGDGQQRGEIKKIMGLPPLYVTSGYRPESIATLSLVLIFSLGI